jgi:hypothetical protein
MSFDFLSIILRRRHSWTLNFYIYNIRRLLAVLLRRRKTSSFALNVDSPYCIDVELGYSLFTLPAQIIHDIVEENTQLIASAIEQKNRKPYLQELTSLKDYNRQGATYSFANSPEIYSAIAKYMGCEPVLWNITYMDSPSLNPAKAITLDRLSGSQLWHLDGEDLKNIKIWIPMQPISLSDGPTYFLPKNLSLKVRRALRWPPGKKMDDRRFYTIANQHDVIPFVTDGQKCLMLDTDNCFHMGSRVTGTQGRRVLLIHYVTKYADYLI